MILQKSKKIHFRDALSEPVQAITSATSSELLLDRRRIPAVADRRVLFVDDGLSTGSSSAAALRLIERAGAHIVGVGAFLAEGDAWAEALAQYRDRVQTLGTIPVFPHP